MATDAHAPSTAGFGLFDSVPYDYFRFGTSKSFQPRMVPEVLGFKREDVSRIASVSVKSVRYDDAIPEPVRERLEEIAITVNLVAQFFEGDVDKTVTWFKTRNPLLGDVSPREMIRLGRFERLRKFIVQAIQDKHRVPAQEPEAV